MTKFIFGCGYLGERVARLWRSAGNDVTIVTRSQVRADQFQTIGYQTIVADILQPATLVNLPAADTVLFAVGFDRTSNQSIETVYAGGIRNVLAALPPGTGRFIYISTTGVYGNAAGDWVDETTLPDPKRDGGRDSLAAEQALAASPFAAYGTILRLAGIYGPGRIPFLEKLRAGEAIPAIETGFLNLIHVDDAATVVDAAARQAPRPPDEMPRVYCVCDGHPVVRGDYYHEVAQQIGAPPPTFMTPDLNSPRAARAESNRRIRNDRMRAELQVPLAFPDYRAGLAAILAGCESAPPAV